MDYGIKSMKEKASKTEKLIQLKNMALKQFRKV